MPASTRKHAYTSEDFEKMSRDFRRTLVNSMAGFRSLALIGTADTSGTGNLAIFNSVLHIGANPPLMGVLFRPLTAPRHTYTNLKASGYFTVNTVTEAILDPAHKASGKFDAASDEFEALGLSPETTKLCPAPYVAESPLNIGLSFEEEHTIAANETVLVVGRVREVRLRAKDVHRDGLYDHVNAGSLTVAGLDAYHRAEKLKRLDYYRPGEELRELTDF